MFFNKEEKSADNFWQEFEEKTGEKVLERSLGKYVSGWDEFDGSKRNGLWGLIITTTGGVHFHHFAHRSMMDSLFRFSEKEPPKEKTFYIPNERIVSKKLIKETKWWKKIFTRSTPTLIIIYKDGTEEKRLVFIDIL